MECSSTKTNLKPPFWNTSVKNISQKLESRRNVTMEAKMPKKCDNTSVAVIVKDLDCRNFSLDRILLIERKIYNPGFALPAGHCDGDDVEKTAKKELFEEVGLTALFLK